MRQTYVDKVMSLLFNTLSRLVIAFLPRSKHLFNFFDAATVCSDFGAQENKICHCFHFFPMYLPWSGRSRCRDLFFFFFSFFFFFVCWVLSHLFHSPLSPPSRGSLVSFHFLPLQWYHLHIWSCWYFSWQSWFQHFTWCILHISWISRVTIYTLDILLSQFGTSLLFHVCSNCCFLICIQISQEADQVVWYSHILPTV